MLLRISEGNRHIVINAISAFATRIVSTAGVRFHKVIRTVTKSSSLQAMVE